VTIRTFLPILPHPFFVMVRTSDSFLERLNSSADDTISVNADTKIFVDDNDLALERQPCR
jgi:hypothetical protein